MAITRVANSVGTINSGNTTSTSMSLVLGTANGSGASQAPTKGNIIVVCASSSAIALTIASDAHITWLNTTKTSTAILSSIFVGYVKDTSGSATITISQVSAGRMAAVGAEYTGFGTDSNGCALARFDVTISASGNSTAPATGNSLANTRSSTGLWVTSIGQSGAEASAPTTQYSSPLPSAAPATAIVGQDGSFSNNAADRTVAMLERIGAATGALSGAATSSVSATWLTYAVAIDDTPTTTGGATSRVFGA